MAEYIPTIWWHHLLGPHQLVLTPTVEGALYKYILVTELFLEYVMEVASIDAQLLIFIQIFAKITKPGIACHID